jgi:hypothetical protein
VSPQVPRKKKAPVAAIAGVVVVLGGAGVAAWSMLGGKPNVVAELDTNATAAADSQAGGAQPEGSQPAAGDTGRTQTGGGRTGGQPQSGGTPGGQTEVPPAPAVDSVALSNELLSLLDRSDDASVIPRLVEIAGNERVPLNLRAEASAIAATTYFSQDDAPKACEQIRRARALAPNNPTYQTTFQRFGCS